MLDRRHVFRGLALAPAAASLASGFPAFAASRAADTPASLQPALDAAAAAAPGRLCVAVRDLAGHAVAGVNRSEPCPMHSSVKLLPAAWAAAQTASGRLRETATVMLRRETSPQGAGRVDREIELAGFAAPSVREMIEAALVDSDNAATDGLYSLAGGPANVARALRLPPGVALSRTMLGQYTPRPQTRADALAWLADPRDKATPDGFLAVLARLAAGRLASPAADARVRALMESSPLGANRIKAGLGADWRLFGRTGSGFVVEGRQTGNNHVALALHRRTGRMIAIASFLKDSAGDSASRDAAHAAVGRAVSEAWPNG